MIIVPKEAPENMEKALRETVDLIGTQLNEIAEKYGCDVSVVAYRDKGDGFGQNAYIAVSNEKYIVHLYRYLTGKFVKDEEIAGIYTN